MAIRRAFFYWLFPAAFVLPVWILIGWGVFQANGWALLWVLFIAMPAVFIGQLALAILIRARGTVRTARAVAWRDVAAVGVWHALVVLVGLFNRAWFWVALIAAIVAFGVALWLTLRALWNEANPVSQFVRNLESYAQVPGAGDAPASSAQEKIIIVEERPRS